MIMADGSEDRPLNSFAINALKNLISNVETGVVTRSGEFFVSGGLRGRGFVCRKEKEDGQDGKMIVTWGFTDSSWRETPCIPPNCDMAEPEDMDCVPSVSGAERLKLNVDC